MAGGRVSGGSRLTVLCQNDGVPLSCEALDSFFLSGSSPTFLGSSSMVSFDGGKRSDKRSFINSFCQEENGDDDFDEYFNQPEKKRRLTAEQVMFLEKSFESENKLEPERKVQLAKELGLQPRQVAIWFQNRRARWKTKQLEKDYEALQASLNSLKADYEDLLKEKDRLTTEVLLLTDKVQLKEKEKANPEFSNTDKLSEEPSLETNSDLASEDELSKLPVVEIKQEVLISAQRKILDSESHSSLFEPNEDLSQDEEDDLSNSLSPSSYLFPKLEYSDYSDPPANSCTPGYPAADQAYWCWSY